ncbi:hypothetical protein METBIDRAFT_42512 [Metschnikowia bicuspidata var. bicuspidata NRRL YB-4993]|uniref:Uncharacterized protein n=1 Tax=Metschnikowia bicuspidata var. bicuspidata NRRL YB-4993 TaxID=869754 RepID=A0A1A0HB25_9ASCO|nr:hypothetical protein METBIDRAFT_42512 [Metschnikowia bicuspidata var. bicuspidata NRRL YB-4993]OBA21082.1 hypothetical protein METBIDRAFT_42512 [Metschnikowia bicuspidata var. bicuspidata NRRL YB-4993]
MPHPTLPWIREARFGITLGERAKAMGRMAAASPLLGPADVVHWGRHYGEKSARFTHNAFEPAANGLRSKEEDGYVGYFHHVNGVDYVGGAAAALEYLAGAVGLVRSENGYLWRAGVDVGSLGTYHDKPMVVTLCAYNTFARAELRVRLEVAVPRSRRSPVPVDALYTIYSHVLKKLRVYTGASVHEVGAAFWTELAALALTRLVLATDDASRRLCGTVNLPGLASTPERLAGAVLLLVALLPKGHLAGARPRFGPPSTCGADLVSTARFRNHVVDALVRLVALDSSGRTAARALDELVRLHGRQFDVVACQLLKADASRNNDLRFLRMVHEHVATHGRQLCQAALMLVEQARFLLARHAHALAIPVAADAVALLPLDFDAWHTLALCYVMAGQHGRALETINAFPVAFPPLAPAQPAAVDGVLDSFATTYMERAQHNQGVDLRTFEAFFPAPEAYDRAGEPVASMATIWHEQFQHQRHRRHPVCGPFHQSPLLLATNLELAAVDSRLMRLAGPGATKLSLAAHSAGEPWASVLDFDSKSTWGRTYDLVTLLVALVGWDQLVHIKNATFRASATAGEDDFVVDHLKLGALYARQWLQLLFLVVYEDLKVMVQMSSLDQDRSALSWALIGFIGWACKFNLKDTLSAFHTSMSGLSAEAGFDYYGTVKMLEIYNEFVLSDVCASTIDPLSSIYDGRQYTNKLIVQNASPEIQRGFVKQLQAGIFSLDNVLLSLSKLVSWNVRWYNYMPSSLVTETLIKLCAEYDALVVRSRLQILMKSLTKKDSKPSATYTLRAMFAAPPDDPRTPHEFVEGDTIMVYMAQLLSWIELLAETK